MKACINLIAFDHEGIHDIMSNLHTCIKHESLCKRYESDQFKMWVTYPMDQVLF